LGAFARPQACDWGSFSFWKARKRDGCHGNHYPFLAVIEGQNTDQIFREMAMNKKLEFIAFGYLLLLAGIGFALDVSITAMIV
jgi:hypothetical protein